MELKIAAKEIIKVHVEDKVYEVSKPNNRQLLEFAKASKSVEESDALEKAIEFLAILGLPAEVSWDLSPGSLHEIVQAVLPQKKS